MEVSVLAVVHRGEVAKEALGGGRWVAAKFDRMDRGAALTGPTLDLAKLRRRQSRDASVGQKEDHVGANRNAILRGDSCSVPP